MEKIIVFTGSEIGLFPIKNKTGFDVAYWGGGGGGDNCNW